MRTHWLLRLAMAVALVGLWASPATAQRTAVQAPSPAELRADFSSLPISQAPLRAAEPAVATKAFQNYVQDPSFEAGRTDNPFWTGTNPDYLAGIPILSNNPNAFSLVGNFFTILGSGADVNSSGIQQNVTVPAGDHILEFYLLAGVNAGSTSTLTVSLGGQTVFTINAADATPYLNRYRRVEVPITVAAGGAQMLLFQQTKPADSPFTNWFLEDVAIYAAPNSEAIFAETFNDSVIPTGWAVFNNGVGSPTGVGVWRPWTLNAGQPFERRIMQSRDQSSAPNREDFLVTPLIALGDDPYVTFEGARNYPQLYPSEYKIRVSTTSQTDLAAFTEVASYTPINFAFPTRGFKRFAVDLSAYAGQSVYIAFVHRQDFGDQFLLDNVEVYQGVDMTTPPVASFSPSVTEGITLATTPGESVTGSLTISNTGGSDLTFAFDDFARGAQRGGADVIYSQDFEGAFPPAGWNNSNAINGCPWLSSDDYPITGFTGTSRGAAIDSDECFTSANPGPADASLISPTIDLTGVTGAMLNFDFAYRHLGSSSTTLGVSTDGGATWTTLQSWTASFGLPASANVMVDLSAYDGQQIQLRWRYQSGWDWWAFVDNVVVSGTSGGGGMDSFVTSVIPAAGTIAPGESLPVTFTLSAEGLDVGTYSETLALSTNEDNGSYAYPVTLVVEEPVVGPELLAYWNFNQSTPGTGGGLGTLDSFDGTGFPADFGAGRITTNFLINTNPTANNGDLGTFGGSTLNARFDDEAGGALAVRGQDNNGRWIQFELNTFGYEDVVMSFAGRGTSTGFGSAANPNVVSVSTDGVNFTQVGTYTSRQTAFELYEFDFGALLDHQTTAYVRITFNDATSASGNNRIDNVVITGLEGEPPVGDGPQAAFNPPISQGLNVSATSGETVEGQITISNVGSEPLDYTFTQYAEGRTLASPANPFAGQLFPVREGRNGGAAMPNWVSTRGEGGPDGFGYSWIDSDAPGGPAFEPINIASTGTPRTLVESAGCTFVAPDEGFAVIDLPFNFSFYGETYSQVWASANGFIAFQPISGCTYVVGQIPSPTAPNAASAGAFIAPLWADLHGYAAGQILTEQLPDGRFVIQYNNWRRFAQETSSNITFQVILSPSGAVKIQYLTVEGTFADATRIGQQNQTGTDGLLIASGPGYAQAGKAVLITSAPVFVESVSPASGTIAPGASQVVTVVFDTEGLLGGEYDGILTIETNEEDGSYDYPVTLNVIGVPGPAVNPSALAFGSVIVGFDAELGATLTNTGTGAFTVTSVSINNAQFTTTLTSGATVAPGESVSFDVTFTPTAPGNASGTLTIETDGGTAQVALTGVGLAPPSFAVNPSELVFEVQTGTVSDPITFALNNTGAGAGAFSITVANAGRRVPTPTNFVASEPRIGTPPEQAVMLSLMSGQPITDARAWGAIDPSRSTPGTLIGSAPTVAVGGVGALPDGRVLVCQLSNGNTTQIFTEDLQPAGSFQHPSTGGGFTTGCTYVPFGDNGNGAIWYLKGPGTQGGANTFVEVRLDGTATGATVPVAAVNSTALMIGASYNDATGYIFMLDIVGDQIYAFNPGTGQFVPGYVIPQGGTCIPTGTGLFGNAIDALGGALDVLVGASSANRPDRVQVIDLEGNCVQDNGQPLFTPVLASVTDDTFINGVQRSRTSPNEIMYLGSNTASRIYAIVPAEREDIGSFLIVEPMEGTVAAGGSAQISVQVDATDLEPGLYSAEILVATNDPANPLLVVDVLVTVAVSTEGITTPVTFALLQNYPNPFARSTTVQFDLPQSSPVKLEVFDVAGRRLATLVDQDMEAGTHRVQWDANGLASGTYLYRIQAGSYSQTLRALIVR